MFFLDVRTVFKSLSVCLRRNVDPTCQAKHLETWYMFDISQSCVCDACERNTTTNLRGAPLPLAESVIKEAQDTISCAGNHNGVDNIFCLRWKQGILQGFFFFETYGSF